MSFKLENIIRKNIREMKPYSSARHEFSGQANVYLDANENAFGSPIDTDYNRYPDPMQKMLKEKISVLKSIDVSQIFLGNGSDEAIDLLFRICCDPGKDNAIICPPTYGMYEVCAAINDTRLNIVPLTTSFQLDMAAIKNAINTNTRLIFICSPNNPTGNCMKASDIENLATGFNGLLVVDEAYIDYSSAPSMLAKLDQYPNLVILQTFSKAWGLAGLRLGMAFSDQGIIDYMNKVKYPYNINAATQDIALKALENKDQVEEWIAETIRQRDFFTKQLEELPFVQQVYPSDANFILVKMDNAQEVYQFLAGRGIIVRDRSRVILCHDCLRITIGTAAENLQLIEALKESA